MIVLDPEQVKQSQDMWLWTVPTQGDLAIGKVVNADVNDWRGRILYSDAGYRPATVDAMAPDLSKIVLSASGVDSLGSISQTVTEAGFRILAGQDFVTIVWDGSFGSTPLVARTADSYKIPIPKGQIAVHGVPAGVPGHPGPKYFVLPYFIPGSCNIGWVKGDVGIPQILHFAPTADAMHKQNYADRIPLSDGPLQISMQDVPAPPPPPPDPLPNNPTPPPSPTPPPPPDPVPPSYPDPVYDPYAGTGPTTGGGDRPIHCVMLGTDIVPLGPSKWWTQQFDQAEWRVLILDNGLQLIATPDHRIYTGRAGLTEMRDIRWGQRQQDWVVTWLGEAGVVSCKPLKRPGVKVCVHMEAGHLFWANGVLSHNVKISPL